MTDNIPFENKPEKTLKRSDISRKVQQETGLSHSESTGLVSDVFTNISDALVRGENVKLAGFGSFILRRKSARLGRNPKTGEECTISARNVVTFKPSNRLRERVQSGPVETKAELATPTPRFIRRTSKLSHKEWRSLFEIIGIFVFLQPETSEIKNKVAVEAIIELKSEIEPQADISRRTISSWFMLNKKRLASVSDVESVKSNFLYLLKALRDVNQKRDIIFSMLRVATAGQGDVTIEKTLISEAILFWEISPEVADTIENKFPNKAISGVTD